MKRIFLLFSLLTLTIFAEAQKSTPRVPYSNGSPTRYETWRGNYELTDASGNDTSAFSPNAHINFVWVNKNDTLKGSKTILTSGTFKGVVYSNANCYNGDELWVMTQNTGLVNDTIFYGPSFVCDTAGSALSNRIIITKDLTRLYHTHKFVWMGGASGKWVDQRLVK